MARASSPPPEAHTIPLRPIDTGGSCQQSGDCCLRAGPVVMTPSERDALLARRPNLTNRFAEWSPGAVALLPIEGRRCPLLAFDAGGLATCTVHDIRPTNCRRFWCGRPDPAAEPFEEDHRPCAVMGCKNLTDRVLQSRPFRREMAHRQRLVMRRWGHKHGWRDDLLGTAE
jgi:Fe-S-cluster containining protein